MRMEALDFTFAAETSRAIQGKILTDSRRRSYTVLLSQKDAVFLTQIRGKRIKEENNRKCCELIPRGLIAQPRTWGSNHPEVWNYELSLGPSPQVWGYSDFN